MAFTALTAAQTDADSPLDQPLFDLIRTNFDDHESRLLAAFAFSSNAIIDDFLAVAGTTGLAASVWTAAGSAGEEPVVASEHQAKFNGGIGAGDFSAIAAAPGKITINITEEYLAVLQCRIKKTSGTNDDFFFGFQDAALGVVAASVADKTDMIGFYRDNAAAAWVFRTSIAGVASETAGVGTSTSWGVARLTVTCSATAGSRRVKVEFGTTEANLAEISGSPFTSNLPTANLRPFFGTAFNSTTTPELRVDYVLAYTTGRPIAA